MQWSSILLRKFEICIRSELRFSRLLSLQYSRGFRGIQTQATFFRNAGASAEAREEQRPSFRGAAPSRYSSSLRLPPGDGRGAEVLGGAERAVTRSEEHTSELQSPCNLVCRLLLEKKKKADSD